ncbi:MAG: 50S ribosomal protein L6 [Candidatus Omnitrophota bacterium]|nr:50S ribosomal protein L6 [Candidatus Omnitrophota bacterium]MBU1928753.1 50S ribosomal protein L6 [Candidatus Omnitrophota bacterium]MBU2034208.1 50S ribosomal protein L6 [Candidatus Omnitrophota bacterium]MBU2222173.1 50S ribosomal protein L6 [Candidatus Omnitrophota bacterium]MBU2257936.1 50S ribosomal protein L6 [Candidatus Omnitrophota bacterium]
MSRIGRKPVNLPKDAKVEIKGSFISVEGPKGKLARTFSDRIGMEVKDNQIFVTRAGDTKLDKGQQGLVRALVGNMLKGVTEGYVKELEINGVGFKALVQGNILTMNLGFSHPVIFNVPEGIKIEVPKPTQIVIRGIDKEKVGELAAEIRSVYPPEPYKGKGVRYLGEYVKKKVGKAQATGGK